MRRDSSAASCQSFRNMARRTYSLVVNPLSRAARSTSCLLLPGRLTVNVALMPVRLDRTDGGVNAGKSAAAERTALFPRAHP